MKKVWVIKLPDLITEVPELIEVDKSSVKDKKYFVDKESAVYGMMVHLKKRIGLLDDSQIKMLDKLEDMREMYFSLRKGM